MPSTSSQIIQAGLLVKFEGESFYPRLWFVSSLGHSLNFHKLKSQILRNCNSCILYTHRGQSWPRLPIWAISVPIRFWSTYRNLVSLRNGQENGFSMYNQTSSSMYKKMTPPCTIRLGQGHQYECVCHAIDGQTAHYQLLGMNYHWINLKIQDSN